MTLSWPNHQIGLEEWEALPDDGEFRLELVEGMLQVSAKPLVDLGSPTTLLAYGPVDGHTGEITLDVAGHPVTLDLNTRTTRWSHISGILFRSTGTPGIIDGRPHRGPRPTRPVDPGRDHSVRSTARFP